MAAHVTDAVTDLRLQRRGHDRRASAAAPNTRRAYATAYRGFAAFLHERHDQASLQTFTVTAVAAWRDELTAQGLAASTVAQRVSAVRRLAAVIGADPLVAQVRCTHVQQERPSALSDRELSALLHTALTCARRSAHAVARSSSSSRARGCAAPNWPD